MSKRVVVTGVGAITPVGLDANESWASIKNGELGISNIKSFDASNLQVKIAAEVKGFDPELKLGKKDSRRLDRFSQFAVVAAMEAIEQSGIDLENEDTTRFSSIVGSGVGGIMTLSEQFDVLHEKGPDRISPFLIPMMLPDMASGNVSMKLGARGINYSPVTACATGTDAIGQAYDLIIKGDIDMAIAGGTEAAICPIAIAGFDSVKALSSVSDPKLACRPFDKERDGFTLGEGAGVLFIESLDHAKSRNANILAEIIGYGASSDAHHITQPSIGGEGAARAMNIAINNASINYSDVNYVNAHGTSTPLNDKFETMSMKTVFKEKAPDIPISSTKSMTGHLLGAAGGVEAVFCVNSILDGIAPPTINYKTPDEDCDLDYTPNEARELDLNVVMSNNLGFGGHNASIIFRKL
ncbi:MAG: beta-ketoacyl-[acyl-carrier-protein] synthase II [Dehalococcoidia bacterium]|nr:beta-ketoacyl-[acyl-carrier-protein] synthase II [Dehalococcoidia bacterium]|tara:strand:- start:1012 stop:2244 length:1233 start_codon:yes stop_codon:yes gene_type:complete